MAEETRYSSLLSEKAYLENTDQTGVDDMPTVEIDVKFYNRLIDIAADSFIGTRLEHIKENLKLEVESAKDEPHLIKLLEDFIEDRAFVTKVISEKQRIEYNKL